ncbi:hypothetical protein AC578_1593 [Pseudocercospora eumusae]|uniref:Uncharacterized protein n=1 Tax=Pseudocercospora eumusae TaxID=321146 RepID=A0A139HM17_9PEZI|nr:hypothetical protein AC578_1593 [Pseudocercospora eumusae]
MQSINRGNEPKLTPRRRDSVVLGQVAEGRRPTNSGEIWDGKAGEDWLALNDFDDVDNHALPEETTIVDAPPTELSTSLWTASWNNADASLPFKKDSTSAIDIDPGRLGVLPSPVSTLESNAIAVATSVVVDADGICPGRRFSTVLGNETHIETAAGTRQRKRSRPLSWIRRLSGSS